MLQEYVQSPALSNLNHQSYIEDTKWTIRHMWTIEYEVVESATYHNETTHAVSGGQPQELTQETMVPFRCCTGLYSTTAFSE